MTDRASDIAAALAVLASLKITPEELLAVPTEPRYVPTFAEFVPEARTATSAGSLKTYDTYWKRLETKWPNRRLDEPSALEFVQLGEWLKANRTVRRTDRGGASTVENFVGAVRRLYSLARIAGHIDDRSDPTIGLKKPDRPASLRRPLAHDRLTALGVVAGETGDDPELDVLIIRLHSETACRRGGALALRPVDLDAEQSLIRLREKGGSDRWQPVSPSLMAGLLHHAAARHAPPNGRLLRYKDGTQLTFRRYDSLFVRLGQHLPWVLRENVNAHWIRHTILQWVERSISYAVARRYGGHENRANGDRANVGSTIVYVKATLEEVAAALSILTGEGHPLADRRLVERFAVSDGPTLAAE